MTYQNYTLIELKEIAKSLNVTGYSKLSKEDLILKLNSVKPNKVKNTRDKIVDAYNKDINWFLVTSSSCHYCKLAKELLTKNNEKFQVEELTNSNRDDILNNINKWTKSYEYIPIIFYKKKFIGGYTELSKIFS